MSEITLVAYFGPFGGRRAHHKVEEKGHPRSGLSRVDPRIPDETAEYFRDDGGNV